MVLRNTRMDNNFDSFHSHDNISLQDEPQLQSMRVQTIRSNSGRPSHDTNRLPPVLRRPLVRSSRSLDLQSGDKWEWSVKKLNPVPPYWCVECNAMHIHGLSPSTVSRRISDFLRVNSVFANYNDNENCVECVTLGLFKFVVYLWQGADDNDVVVEVQRRSGCTLGMRRLRRCLYRSITNDTGEPSIMERSRHDIPSSVSLSSEEPPKQPWVASKHEGYKQAFVKTQELLESSREDRRRLGLENLAALLDPSSTEHSVAPCVAEALLCGTGNHAERVRTAIGEYFHDFHMDRDTEGCLDDDENWETKRETSLYARGAQFGILHLLALAMLENALAIILKSRTNGNGKPRLDIRSWFWRNVMDALMYNIEVASKRPLEAVLSTKCLNLIVTLEPEVQHCRVVEERLIPGLVYAHNFGACRLLDLEREAENLMESLR